MVELEKSQKEVWEWKEKVSEEIKGFSPSEIREFFRKVADNFQGKYNLKSAAHKSLTAAR